MKYLDKTFSAPAGPANISQRDWDYATLSRDEFIRKHYPMDPMRYGDPRIDFSVTSRQCWAHGPLCIDAEMHHLFKYHHPDGDPELRDICAPPCRECIWPYERRLLDKEVSAEEIARLYPGLERPQS